MGKVWLHDSPDLIREAGLPLELAQGWELRSRSSGGFEEVRGIGGHHDARRIGQSDEIAENWMWFSDQGDQPIGNFRVRQSAANTMGKGGPLVNSKGQTIPLNDGNRWMIAIEAENNGLGEPWPEVQITNYLRLVVVLCRQFGLDPGRDYWGHFGYCAPSCPGRKIDPSGPTPGYPELGGLTGNKIWADSDFRRLAINVTSAIVEPLPAPTPVPAPQGDAHMIYFVAKAPGSEGGSVRMTVDFGTQVRFGNSDQINQFLARCKQLRGAGVGAYVVDYATGKTVETYADITLVNDIWKMGAIVSSMPPSDPTPG